MTRKFAFLFCVSAIAFALASCCTKKYCPDANDIHHIKFDQFAVSDLDSITITEFEKNTGFSTQLSQVELGVYDQDAGDSTIINLTRPLSWEYDYKIYLASTGQTFLITEMKVKSHKCNNGFMCSDDYKRLETYKVNGTEREPGTFLEISN